VDVIEAKELRKLEKSYLQLSDIFKDMDIEIESQQKTDLDFFRCKK
jgi:t-SNARE complex subunit (syntaxin)